MVYVGLSKRGKKLHIARFPWKPGPAWCGVQITSKVHFRLNAEGPGVCRLCVINIDKHLKAKYRPKRLARRRVR